MATTNQIRKSRANILMIEKFRIE